MEIRSAQHHRPPHRPHRQQRATHLQVGLQRLHLLREARMVDAHGALAVQEQRLHHVLVVAERRGLHAFVDVEHPVVELERAHHAVAADADVAPGRMRQQFVEDRTAIGPRDRHEAIRRVALVLLSAEAVAVGAGLVVDDLRETGELVPRCRRLVGIKPCFRKECLVVEEEHHLVVRGDPVKGPFAGAVLAHAHKRAGQELAGGDAELLLVDFGALAVVDELRRPLNGGAHDVRRVAGAPRHRQLRQHVGVAEDGRGELELRILAREILGVELGLRLHAELRRRVRPVPGGELAREIVGSCRPRKRARRQAESAGRRQRLPAGQSCWFHVRFPPANRCGSSQP